MLSLFSPLLEISKKDMLDAEIIYIYKVIKSHDNENSIFAYITFNTISEAETAVSDLNGQT